MNGARTARLRFREATLDDTPFLFELLNEPAWRRYIGDPGPPTPAGARRYLEGRLLPLYRDGLGLWLLENGAGRAIGLCGLVERDFLPAADLGFALLARQRRRGYAAEAARAVLDYARDTLGLARVQAITRADNSPSVALLRALQFRYLESTARPASGEPIDVYERRLRPPAAAAGPERSEPCQPTSPTSASC